MSENKDRSSIEPRYDVVWPLGHSAVKPVEAKRRPDNLDGKTVGFIWDYLFRGPEMFDAVKEELQERYHDVRFVDYETFGNVHGSDVEEQSNLDAIPTLLRQERVDLVVVAVGA